MSNLKPQNLIKHSVTIKLISIIILVLLLLIPSAMIMSIIEEREMLNNSAIAEVSSKWANEQVINGPILTIPLLINIQKDDELVELTKYYHVLPEELNVAASVDPKSLKRGIYEIVVYKSVLAITGHFKLPKDLKIKNLKEIKWSDAFLTMGISDLRGIEDQLSVVWNKQNMSVIPGSKIPEIIHAGVTIDVSGALQNNQSNQISFSIDMNLQGSKNMSFTPIGSSTNVTVNSPWPSPSFNGNFLPDHREVTQKGFEASWKVLQLNRNYPQFWLGNHNGLKIQQSGFGFDLMLPLDDYQKSMRSAKYAIMTIALTFLIFFLIEILNGRKIHPFQYTLVGLSLCLFYTLLISISEHSSFKIAYAIATFSIVSLISVYSLSLFKAKKLTMLLTVTLLGVYGFVYVTLQLADYALLMGSIGLFATMAATMYFTRKIDWYNVQQKVA